MRHGGRPRQDPPAPAARAQLRVGTGPLLVLLLSVAGVVGLLGLAQLVGARWAVLLSLAACLACGVTAVAFRFPLTTVTLTVLLGQAIDRDLIELDVIGLPSFGGLLLRYFDPVLLGIVAATLLKMMGKDVRLGRFLVAYWGWLVLVGVLVLAIARSVGEYGIVSSLGEFRTYYQYLLLVPYIAVAFRTPSDQMRLFRRLIVLGLLFIPLALIRGGLDYGFTIGPRWFNASSNFALLASVVAILIGARRVLPYAGGVRTWFVLTAFAFLTLVNTHRSIWAASAVAFGLSWVTGSIPVRRQAQIVAVALVAIFGATLMFQASETDFVGFLETRALAFTNPEADPTANWRLVLWQQALEQIADHPVAGVGLGRNFDFDAPGGQTVTTSPHSFYLTLAYHAGVVALGAYVLFLLQLFGRGVTSLVRSASSSERAVLLASLIVVAAGHVVFVVYEHEFFTLLYAGLVVSITLNESGWRRPAHGEVSSREGRRAEPARFR